MNAKEAKIILQCRGNGYSEDEFNEALEMAYSALDSSLPSDIDEAAIRAANEMEIPTEHSQPESLTLVMRHIAAQMFKAGAEWMARQGQTFAAHFDDGYGCAVASGVKLPFVLWNTYEDGDVLKVQIRKKQ